MAKDDEGTSCNKTGMGKTIKNDAAIGTSNRQCQKLNTNVENGIIPIGRRDGCTCGQQSCVHVLLVTHLFWRGKQNIR